MSSSAENWVPGPNQRTTARARLAHRVVLKGAGVAIRSRRPVPSQSRAKVTFLLMSAYAGGGIVRSVMHLAGQLAEDRDVEIVSVLRGRKTPLFPFPSGVRVTVLDDRYKPAPAGPRRWARSILRRCRGRLLHPWDYYGPKTDLWSDLALVRYLRRARSGVLIATRPSFGFLGAEIARRGLIVIAQEHLNLASRWPAMQSDIRRTYGRLDAITVLTDTDRRAYEGALGGAGRVVCIPNGVPASERPPSDLSNPVAIAAGRLTPQKGFDLLVSAYAQVAREQPEWTLKICGHGPLRHSLMAIAEECGVANRLVLPRHVPDMESELQQASIFVLSSRWEGFPLVVIEAMAKGLPVVAFDCPTGPAELVEHGVTGLLVPAGDTGALAAAMLELMRDEDKRRRFGAAAVERAANYNLDSIAKRWDALLAELAA
jgi:glycosyltransferase involved in cell wall biosynthesis